MATGEAQRIDGRRARGERAREAVAEALLALFAEGELNPPAPRIAQRAGVSQRLLYHHFADLEALFDAVAERQLERITGVIQPIPRELPLEERLQCLVVQRAQIYEVITPVRRAALLHEHCSPAVSQRLQLFRSMKRGQVVDVLSPELQALPPGERELVAAALGAAASWSAWEALRSHQGLSVERAQAVMARTLRSLLLVPPGAP